MADPSSDSLIKILLIDDQPVVKVLLDRMLATADGQGMVLHYVQDPLTAEMKAQEIQPLVILLDLMMPNMDGLELLTRFRHQEVTRGVPIVMLSAIEESHQKAEAFAKGASDYVVKLPDPVEMLARLRHHGNARLAQIRQQQAEMALRRHRDHLEEMVMERTAALSNALAVNQEQEAYLRAILENAMDAIISIDPQGRVVDYNPAAEELFGYSKGEAIGQAIDALIIPPEWRDRHLTALAHHSESNGSWHSIKRRVDIPGLCKDGKIIDMEMTLTSVNRNGEPHFSAFIHDITSRKQLLRSLEQTLAVAQSASQAKSEFIANMSHEIRTPMNAIIGLSHLAIQSDPSPKILNYLQTIKNSSHTLLSLVNDILDFSRMDANRMKLEPAPFNLSDLFDRLEDLFSEPTANKGIELGFVLPKECHKTLFGDALRFEQILINLISNAVKFTETGSIVVRVHGVATTPESVQLDFSVQDTGIGIDPDQLESMFEPFVQVDGTSTRKYGGVGLGLAICKQLVDLMEGNIWAESIPGNGSIFHFNVVIPYQGKEENVLAIPTHLQGMDILVEDDHPVSLDITAICAKIGGARILLVEDNPINQQVAREILEQVGLVVTVANNGLEATQMVLESPFDLVFMDIQMPVMDGYAAARQIRGNPRFEKLPIIAMTAHAMEEDRRKSLAVGMNGHVTKPIDCQQLYATLLYWIEPGDRPKPAVISVPERGAAATDGWDVPMSLPGIDVAASLNRLGGNHKLYRSLLREFHRDYHNAVARFRVFLAGKRQDDVTSASSLVHTIKGVSGNLGARALHGAARDLEQGIKLDHREVWPDLLDRLERTLTVVLESIALLPAEKQNESIEILADVSLDIEAITPLVEEIFSRLKKSDINTEEPMASLEKLLKGTHMHQELALLAEHIVLFDFDAAVTTLSAMANSLNLPLSREV